MKPRVVVVFYLMALFVFYLGYNLVQVQARQRLRNAPPKGFSDFKGMANAYHVGSLPLPALRGPILDRNRQILAASLSLPSIAADPTKIPPEQRDQVALFVARAMNGDVATVRKLLNTHGTFVWLGQKMPEKVAERIEKYARERDAGVPKNLQGGLFVLREATGKRFYPKGKLAVHLLGYAGIDDNGLDGIESAFEQQLKGIPGQIEAEMDREGRAIPNGWSKLTPARPGRSVVLTIDESIQYIAERELAATVKKYQATSGTCVVMDAKSGDILALVNKPDYTTAQASKVDVSLRRNRALSDTYEPGSTMKVFTAAAALDSGKVSMSDRFFCGTTITVDGWQIHNADDGESSANGSENVLGIVTHSFNVGTCAVALRIGKKTFQQYLDRFGFGRTTDLPLPGEAEGLIQPYKGWANITLATNAFGQGITVTPMQLVSAMQAVANKGVMMKPRLVKELLDPDGKVVKAFPTKVKRRVVSERTSMQMRQILRNVVVNGTGKKAENAAYPSAGKTGTANIVDGGGYGHRYNASFLGFAPVQDPRVVILVKVEDPKPIHWGGSVAAPVFKAVSREALWRLGVRPLDVVEKDDKDDESSSTGKTADAKAKSAKTALKGAKGAPAGIAHTGGAKAASTSKKGESTVAPAHQPARRTPH